MHADAAVGQGALDPQILEYASGHQRVIITANDDDFIEQFLGNHPNHPGLIAIDEQNTRVVQIAEMLNVVAEVLRHIQDGNGVAGYVFKMRKTGRFVAKRFPP